MEIIYKYIKNEGYPPTFDEMRNKLGVSSNQSVLDLLIKLEKNQIIQRKENSARGLAILPVGYRILGRPPLAAFLGVTSAGSPLEMVEITGEWQPVSSEVARLRDEVFLLKISGDSMVNAGIEDGDVVLVKREREFISGDVVLARINDESTVKRFMSDDKPPYVYLKPENPKYSVMPFTEEMRLEGKIISILKGGYWKPVM